MGPGDRTPTLIVPMDNNLRSLLETLDPKARNDLRSVLSATKAIATQSPPA